MVERIRLEHNKGYPKQPKGSYYNSHMEKKEDVKA